MDMDSVIFHIKSKHIYADFAGDVRKRFSTSKYDVKMTLTIGKNKKKIGFMMDELGGKVTKDFGTLKHKMYNDLTDDVSLIKKERAQKMYYQKRNQI